MNDKASDFANSPELLKALENEEIAFQIAADFARKTEYEHSDGNSIRAQDWFHELAQFFSEYRKHEFGDFSRGSEIFGRVQRLLEALAIGKLPDPVRLATIREGNKRWPAERKDVATAVFYVEAARNGEIVDRSFNKTVCLHYNVQPQTVRRWVRDRDQICEGIKKPPVSRLPALMEAHGRRYKSARTGRKSAEY